jgi:hypothetical protein
MSSSTSATDPHWVLVTSWTIPHLHRLVRAHRPSAPHVIVAVEPAGPFGQEKVQTVPLGFGRSMVLMSLHTVSCDPNRSADTSTLSIEPPGEHGRTAWQQTKRTTPNN